MNSNFISQPYPRSCFYSTSRYWVKKEIFQHTLVILFRKFLEILAFPRLLGQAQHPLLTLFVFLLPGLDAVHPEQQNSSSNAENTPTDYVHLGTQPTPSYLYTSMHTAKIVDGLGRAGTCGWLLVSNRCLFVSFILPGLHSSLKKKILPTSYSCDDQVKRRINVRTVL